MSNREINDAIDILLFITQKMEQNELTVDDPRFSYVIGRNLRILKEYNTDFIQCRNDALREFGEYREDEKGRGTYAVDMKNKAQFGAFDERMKKILDIKHEVELYAIPINVFSEWKLPFSIQSTLCFLVQEDEIF